MPLSQPDILIAGGGVTGLTTALLLAREGASVLVLDRSETGREASWAGAGMLPPGNVPLSNSPEARLRSLSHSLWPKFAAELQGLSGIDNGYRVCGSVLLFASHPAADAAAGQWRNDGTDALVLSGSQLDGHVPGLNKRDAAAIFLPQFAQVRNPRHLKALRIACELAGVQFREQAGTLKFTVRGERIHSVRTPDDQFNCSRICLTAGAWTAGIMAELAVTIPVKPIRGQIVQLQVARLPFQCVIEEGRRYLVPRTDGLILIGSTEEDVGFHKANTVEGVSGLLDFATSLVPELNDAEIARTWSGLRPGSPDELPLLGSVPGFDNLWIGAGHFRSGLQMSPGTALILSQLILGNSSPISLEGFAPDRFRKS
jgi:glycine oxidase